MSAGATSSGDGGPPWAAPAEDVVRSLGTDAVRGLAADEAVARLVRVGPNRLAAPARPPYGRIAARQLADPLVLLLAAAAAVSFGLGELLQAAAILVIVLANAVLGFAEEARAERDVMALRDRVRRTAAVIRDGRAVEIPVDEIVPGDLVVASAGERVSADGRLVEAHGLEADESLLTGESVPVAKSAEPVPSAAPAADRTSLLYAGTSLTRGRGRFVVTATGDRTALGEVAELVSSARRPPTPLERRLAGMTRLLVVAGILITVVLGAALFLRGEPRDEAFLVAVSVAVAAVPEGLVAAVTITLALGASAMAARGAIVRRLAAVETLGSATVIASDKTGTLTQNRLAVESVLPAPGRTEEDVLAAAVLASAVETAEEHEVADPLDAAVLAAARARGITRETAAAGRRVLREVPFHAERRRSALVYRDGDGAHAFVKGAPEAVLDGAAALEEVALAWARDGLRVVAVAERRLAAGEAWHDDAAASGLEPVGLLGLRDPLRPTAAASVRHAREAGIHVKILTGDHPATANAVARELGIAADAVAARVTPADKLDLVRELQEAGEVVAVTGDGVNDAPALRQADVGVAMGKAGTEAAREASDLVLTDDDFSTIVAAIGEGRRVRENIGKFVFFLLSANLGEVALFAAAVLAGIGIPMTVVQVLTVNVLTDGLPAVALSRDPVRLSRLAPPRPPGELLRRASWWALLPVGLLVGAAATAAYLVGRGLDDGDAAQTMTFATVALAELALVFTIRGPDPAWRAPRNRDLLWAVGISLVLTGLFVYVPFLQEPFGTVALGASELAVVAALALVPAALVELGKRSAALRGLLPGGPAPVRARA
jgi:calcium-translocating P-type ATPase